MKNKIEKIKFTITDVKYGCIDYKVSAGLQVCSTWFADCWDPLPALKEWLELIASGSNKADFEYDAEGPDIKYVFKNCFFYNQFIMSADNKTPEIKCKVSRYQLVSEIYNAIMELGKWEKFDRREWEDESWMSYLCRNGFQTEEAVYSYLIDKRREELIEIITDAGFNYCLDEIPEDYDDLTEERQFKILVEMLNVEYEYSSARKISEFRSSIIEKYLETRKLQKKNLKELKNWKRWKEVELADNEAILEAFKFSREKEEVMHLINKAENIFFMDENNCTYLHHAARACKFHEIIRLLVEKGLDVNAKDDRGLQPLHQAAAQNLKQKVCLELIKCGAQINGVTVNGFTPIFEAVCINSNFEVAKLLLKHGAAISVRNNYGLYVYDYKPGSVQALEYILKKYKGRQLFLNTGFENIAHFAAQIRNYRTLMLYKKYILDTPWKDNEGNSFIHLLAKYNTNIKLIKLLLRSGYDVNSRNKDGKTPLYYALGYNKNHKVAEALLKAGADWNNITDNNLIQLPYNVFKYSNRKMLKLILKNMPDINKPVFYGRTILQMAIISKATAATLKLLLKKGADPDYYDKYESTPLIKLLNNNFSIKKAELLLNFNNDTTAKKNSLDAAFLSASEDLFDLKTLKYLLDRGACINAADKKGNTALHLLCSKEQYKYVSFLLENGADPAIKNNAGESVLDIAIEKQLSAELITILERYKK